MPRGESTRVGDNGVTLSGGAWLSIVVAFKSHAAWF
jgi:hypothetical protein